MDSCDISGSQTHDLLKIEWGSGAMFTVFFLHKVQAIASALYQYYVGC